MDRRQLMMSALGAAASSLIALGAQAAPMQVTANVTQSNVEQVARRCWVENGVRYCSRASKAYSSDYRVRIFLKRIPLVPGIGGKRWIAKAAAVVEAATDDSLPARARVACCIARAKKKGWPLQETPLLSACPPGIGRELPA